MFKSLLTSAFTLTDLEQRQLQHVSLSLSLDLSHNNNLLPAREGSTEARQEDFPRTSVVQICVGEELTLVVMQVDCSMEPSDWTPYNSNLHMQGIKVQSVVLREGERRYTAVFRSEWTPPAQM